KVRSSVPGGEAACRKALASYRDRRSAICQALEAVQAASMRACMRSMSFEQEAAYTSDIDAVSMATLSGIKRLMGTPSSQN
ncbi:MAG: hypothetical protein ACLQDV_02770, partial [Candidatus Binataceae bacterium]